MKATGPVKGSSPKDYFFTSSVFVFIVEDSILVASAPAAGVISAPAAGVAIAAVSPAIGAGASVLIADESADISVVVVVVSACFSPHEVSDRAAAAANTNEAEVRNFFI